MDYVKNLQFEDKPDYKWMQTMFKDLFYKCKFNDDMAFDWTVLQMKMIKTQKKKESQKSEIKEANVQAQ